MQCMNASLKVMDKIIETPDENGLSTLKVFTGHIKLNTTKQSNSFITKFILYSAIFKEAQFWYLLYSKITYG